MPDIGMIAARVLDLVKQTERMSMVVLIVVFVSLLYLWYVMAYWKELPTFVASVNYCHRSTSYLRHERSSNVRIHLWTFSFLERARYFYKNWTTRKFITSRFNRILYPSQDGHVYTVRSTTNLIRISAKFVILRDLRRIFLMSKKEQYKQLCLRHVTIHKLVAFMITDEPFHIMASNWPTAIHLF